MPDGDAHFEATLAYSIMVPEKKPEKHCKRKMMGTEEIHKRTEVVRFRASHQPPCEIRFYG